MILIKNNVVKKQNNFWNHCLFHPTDAVEDPWGKRILDQMSKDRAINTVRIYTMFEDIVYLDEDMLAEGEIACPNCGTNLEFDFDCDCDCCDGDCDCDDKE